LGSRLGIGATSHTNATIDLEAGTYPNPAQDRFGQSTIAKTLNRYSHVSTDMRRYAADRFDDRQSG
jgi:hypothetical protein